MLSRRVCLYIELMLKRLLNCLQWMRIKLTRLWDHPFNISLGLFYSQLSIFLICFHLVGLQSSKPERGNRVIGATHFASRLTCSQVEPNSLLQLVYLFFHNDLMSTTIFPLICSRGSPTSNSHSLPFQSTPELSLPLSLEKSHCLKVNNFHQRTETAKTTTETASTRFVHFFVLFTYFGRLFGRAGEKNQQVLHDLLCLCDFKPRFAVNYSLFPCLSAWLARSIDYLTDRLWLL